MGGASAVPIIDVFAGPGGLGEGFSALTDQHGARAFRIALSVEKEPVACATLRLRALRRHLAGAGKLDVYYAMLRGEIVRSEFDALPIVQEALAEVRTEIMNAELGKCDAALVDGRIRNALDGATNWVLIGGPPVRRTRLPDGPGARMIWHSRLTRSTFSIGNTCASSGRTRRRCS